MALIRKITALEWVAIAAATVITLVPLLPYGV